MFTGIVEATGGVEAVETTAEGHRLRIGAAFAPDRGFPLPPPAKAR